MISVRFADWKSFGQHGKSLNPGYQTLNVIKLGLTKDEVGKGLSRECDPYCFFVRMLFLMVVNTEGIPK